MRISARAEYAVKAAVEIAYRSPDLVKSEAISDAQQIPIKFLEIILADLRRAGVVRSKRGADGGYQLSRPAEEISLADVIRAVDGPLAWVRDERPGSVEYEGPMAPVRDVWVAVRASIRSVLDGVTLADVIAAELPESVTRFTSEPSSWID